MVTSDLALFLSMTGIGITLLSLGIPLITDTTDNKKRWGTVLIFDASIIITSGAILYIVKSDSNCANVIPSIVAIIIIWIITFAVWWIAGKCKKCK
ncbi:MAG: hypothetical protein WC359_11885 [Dehalococcoidia bacterium]|jgi:hypothetical protein